MRRGNTRRVGVTVVLTVSMWASSVSGEASLYADASGALKKATVYFRSMSTNGGYCGIYSVDLKQRYGESLYEKAGDNEIWVQPPGTPAVGQCYLRAWKATGEEFYLDAARDVARALVWGQRAIGGWDHLVDVSHLTAEAKMPRRNSGRCTFDDNITQGALEFLIDADEVIDEEWLDNGVELGLSFMLSSQFDNGAWPQWYPLRGGYHDYYTFNDNSMNDCISVMLKAHKVYSDKRYLESAEKCGWFIIASQLAAPQAGWAQQYDHDMKPGWARSFEPPGVCSAATVRNIRTLINLFEYTGKREYLEPIQAAIDWLNDSMIGEHLWARLYEVGSNKPIYGDRTDGNKAFYDYARVSEKERSSYGWQGEYGIESILRHWQDIKSAPEKLLDRRAPMRQSETQRRRRGESMDSAVRRVIASVDDKGRWVSNDMITCRDYVQNATVLIEYLELTASD